MADGDTTTTTAAPNPASSGHLEGGNWKSNNPNTPYAHMPPTEDPDFKNWTTDQQMNAVQTWMKVPVNSPAENDVQAQRQLAYKQWEDMQYAGTLKRMEAENLQSDADKAAASGDMQKAAELREQAHQAQQKADSYDQQTKLLDQRQEALGKADDARYEADQATTQAKIQLESSQQAQQMAHQIDDQQREAYTQYQTAQSRADALSSEKNVAQQELQKAQAALDRASQSGNEAETARLNREVEWRQGNVQKVDEQLTKAKDDAFAAKQTSDDLYSKYQETNKMSQDYAAKAAEAQKVAEQKMGEASQALGTATTLNPNNDVLKDAGAAQDLPPVIPPQPEDQTDDTTQQPTDATDTTTQPTDQTDTTTQPTDDTDATTPPTTDQSGDGSTQPTGQTDDATQPTGQTDGATQPTGQADGLAPDPDALDQASVAASSTPDLTGAQAPADATGNGATGATDVAPPADDSSISDQPSADQAPQIVDFGPPDGTSTPDVTDQTPQNTTPEIPDVTTPAPDTDGGTLPDIQDTGPDDGSSAPDFGSDQPTDTDPVSVGADDSGGGDDGGGDF